MTLVKKIALLGAVAAGALGFATADAATIVNVSAGSANGTTLALDAGEYSFSFIGTTAGGAYDAWNAWQATSGCNGSGTDCTQGWLVSLGLDFGNALGAFDRTNGLQFWQSTTPTDSTYYATDLQANVQAQTAFYKGVPLTNGNAWNSYASSQAPFFFDLSSAQDVNFFIKDSNYSDNAGGVSIELTKVSSPVPEPATWAMMLVGFGALAATMRRRKVETQVSFAG